MMWLIEKLFPNLVLSKWAQIAISLVVWLVVILIVFTVVFFSGANWQKNIDAKSFSKYKEDQATAKAAATKHKQATTDTLAASIVASEAATNVVYKTITKRVVQYVYKNASSASGIDPEWVQLYNESICGGSSTACRADENSR